MATCEISYYVSADFYKDVLQKCIVTYKAPTISQLIHQLSTSKLITNYFDNRLINLSHFI